MKEPLTIDKRTATVTYVNLRKEFHGEETEKAADVGLDFVAQAAELASLFGEKTDELFALMWDDNGMPAAGAWHYKHAARIDKVSAKISRLQFEGARIKPGMTLIPGMNRTFAVRLKLQIWPGSKHCADTLWSLRQDDCKISLSVAQLELDLEPADADQQTDIDDDAALSNPETPNP